MKLPNFNDFEAFEELRKKMGTKERGHFNMVVTRERITDEEATQLEEDGFEIDSLDLIYELDDSTLAFKNTRVLLYIRDSLYIKRDSQDNNLPKFHVSWCSTLKQKKKDGSFGKYVLSTRTDGRFEIRKTGSSTTVSTEELKVCKNCLQKLHYNAYNSRNEESLKEEAVNNFTLTDFFRKYPKSPLNAKPKYTSATAATNDYPSNWDNISHAYRNKNNWKCEQCGIDFSSKKGYLQTHHINGIKNECGEENLKALCIPCHAEQPNHSHMKRLPNYSASVRWVELRQNSP